MATAVRPSGSGTQTQVITLNNLVKNWNTMTQNQQANNYVKYKNKLNNKLTQEQKNKVIKYINSKKFTGIGRILNNKNIISRTDLLMMAKFITFNKMTRDGMKNTTNNEMAFYDYLVNFFIKTAKVNTSITREKLQESLEKEFVKLPVALAA
jgi:hypothetical protein